MPELNDLENEQVKEPEDQPDTSETPVVENEQDEVEDTQSETVDDRSWYVVHCYSGYENKVRHN
jgi:transcriptional antiterminator NusG